MSDDFRVSISGIYRGTRFTPFGEGGEILVERRIAELEKRELGYIQSLRELEADNKALRELVVRMYQHCTIKSAELTSAEFDEWMLAAAEAQK